MSIRLKRAYEPAEASDGTRVLIDRLWPRGVSKEEEQIDLWLKDVAPSGQLRKWFGHDPAKWPEFQARYKKELKEHPDAVDQLKSLSRKGPVTLVFGAKDEQHNDAVVLQSLIAGKGPKSGGKSAKTTAAKPRKRGSSRD